MKKEGKKIQLHHEVASQEHFAESFLDEKSQCCNIIDVFLDWCGPCKPMEQNYKTLWFGVTDGDPEGRIAFWQCSSEFVPEEIKAKIGEVTLIPKFVVMKGGEIKKVIEGARYTEL